MVDASGVLFTVSAPDLRSLTRLVDGLPRGWERGPSEASDGPRLRFALVREQDGYRIRDEQGLDRYFTDGDLALWMLRRHIRDVVCGLMTDAIPIRAAIVTFGGEGVLLPARTLAGTTTLLEALLRAGGTQYTDEIVTIFSDGLSAAYGEAGPGPMRVMVPLRLVALTDYRPGATWSPNSLSVAQGVAALMAFVVTSARRAEALTVLRRALEPATVVMGDRGDADETARAMIASLGSPTAQT